MYPIFSEKDQAKRFHPSTFDIRYSIRLSSSQAAVLRFAFNLLKFHIARWNAPASYKFKRKGIVRNLICYCFGYSVDDIHQDYLKNGRSTIMERIQMEKKFGNCQCTTKNPTGKWCLGDIRRVVDKLKGEGALFVNRWNPWPAGQPAVEYILLRMMLNIVRISFKPMDMKMSKCKNCKLRARFDNNPRSILGRIWKWHIGWCPGWKAYLKSLSDEDRRKLTDQYF